MTAMRRTFVLALWLLLAATPAAADTVITIDEVLACSVESAGPDSVLVRMTRPSRRPRSTRDRYEINRTSERSRMIPISDIYEIRLADPDRVTGMTALLPRTKVTVDSGQAVPSPEARGEALVDRWAEAMTGDSVVPVGTIDTLPRNAQPAQMAERCWEMKQALLGCGRGGRDIAQLLRDVDREERAVQAIWPSVAPCATGAAGAVVGGIAGSAIGEASMPARPSSCSWDYTGVEGSSCVGDPGSPGGGPAGAIIGCAAGSLIGTVVGIGVRNSLLASHRVSVNVLVKRVNRAVADAPPGQP